MICATCWQGTRWWGTPLKLSRLIFNRGHNGLLTDEEICPPGNVACFEGGLGEEPGYLEAIYQSAAIGKEIILG